MPIANTHAYASCRHALKFNPSCAHRLAIAVGSARGPVRNSFSGFASTSDTEDRGLALLDNQWKSLWAVEQVWEHKLLGLTNARQFVHSGKEQDCNGMSQQQQAICEASTADIWAIKVWETVITSSEMVDELDV